MTSTVAEREPTSRWLRLTVEPRRPSWVRDRPGAYRLAVGAVCVGAFMGQLDASIVTQAFPALERSFHASVGSVTWVGLSYLLVLTATLAAVGRFADMFGRKLLYVYGFLVFIAGSGLCAVAPDLWVLCAFRVVQAIGAAMLQANSVAIITLASPPERLGRSIGVQGAAQALGLALGPSVGGLLLAVGGWRLIFLVNVPVGLLGVVAGLVFIPRSRHLQQRVAFDWWGFALFFPAVVTLLSAISWADSGGWTSPVVLGLLSAAVALGVLFVALERGCRAPMLDPALLRSSRFATGLGSAMLSFLVMFGLLEIVPFRLERGEHLGVARAGLELMVMPLALGLVAPLAGRLVDRIGVRVPAVAGMSFVAVGLAGMGLLHPGTGAFLGLLAVTGVGMGLFMSPNNTRVMTAVAPGQSGLASGVLNMGRGIGTALGLAVTASVFTGLGGVGEGAPVLHAFDGTALVLAALAAAAGVIAWFGAGDGRTATGGTGSAAAATGPHPQAVLALE